MLLAEVIPDPDALCALEPYELGLRMLPVLAQFKPLTPLYDELQLGLKSFLNLTLGTAQQPGSQYPVDRRREIEQAIREAWSWLEGAALLVDEFSLQGPCETAQPPRTSARVGAEPAASNQCSIASRKTLYTPKSARMYGAFIIARNMTPPSSRR